MKTITQRDLLEFGSHTVLLTTKTNSDVLRGYFGSIGEDDSTIEFTIKLTKEELIINLGDIQRVEVSLIP
jgi:hypothetical protein